MHRVKHCLTSIHVTFTVTEQVRGCVAENHLHGRVILQKCLKPIHHFKAYRTKNDVDMFLTGEIEYKIYCDQQLQNGAIFINAANSRRILAFRSKQ